MAKKLVGIAGPARVTSAPKTAPVARPVAPMARPIARAVVARPAVPRKTLQPVGRTRAY